MVFQPHPAQQQHEVAERLTFALNGGQNTIIDATADVNPVFDFARSAARTLSECPKWLECRFLYDATGSALFERICEQPEYYLTRTEAALLDEYAGDIAKLTGPATLVELGSGNSSKTRHILSAYARTYNSARYVPVDVSKAALRQACESITAWHPAVKVAGVKGIYDCIFPSLQALSPAVVIFLGSTIGNFYEEQDRRFWRAVSRSLSQGDYFLLGVDLVKDLRVLESAYNDRAGVSAAFTLNLFERMNRELKAGIDLAHVRHVARFSSLKSRIEIFGHFERDQRISIKPINAQFIVSAGERIHVEISRKYNLEDLVPYLTSFGFRTRRIFTDSRKWFALLLLERAGRNE